MLQRLIDPIKKALQLGSNAASSAFTDDTDADRNDLRGDPPVWPLIEKITSKQDAVFAALGHAADMYYLQNFSALYNLDRNLRLQLKLVTVTLTPGNEQLLESIRSLNSRVLKLTSLKCMQQTSCAEVFDFSEYFGFQIVPGEEVAGGEAVMTLACVGQENIPLVFSFAGDVVPVEEGGFSPTALGGPVDGFTLRLNEGGKPREIGIERFPVVIGKSRRADIQVDGHFVSREHATLSWDSNLSRVVLRDHSSNSTWFNGVDMGKNGKVILRGSGSFCLSSPENHDAPVFEFSYKGVQASDGTTPLCVGASGNTGSSQRVGIVAGYRDVAVRKPDEANAVGRGMDITTAKTLITGELSDRTITACPPGKFSDSARRAAADTLLVTNVPEPSNERKIGLTKSLDASPDAKPPLAYLQVRSLRNPKGEIVPICSLPFNIGREPQGDGYTVAENYPCVSRQHLCLLELRGGSFMVENGAAHRNNTYQHGRPEDSRFLWQPSDPKSDAGWYVLGGSKPDDKTVEVRLIAAAPNVPVWTAQ